MTSASTDLDVFKFGTTQLIAVLPDEIDDKAAESTIRYILIAVDKDAEKLEALAHIIYKKDTDNSDCIAKLLVRFFENAPQDFSAVVVDSQEYQKGLGLAVHYWLRRGQEEFEKAMQCRVWPRKVFNVTIALFKVDWVASGIIGHLLWRATEAEHLFLRPNFETFAHLCMICGPKLSLINIPDYVAQCLNDLSIRASTQSLSSQLIVAGLLDAHENDWNIKTSMGQRSPSQPDMPNNVKVEPSGDVP